MPKLAMLTPLLGILDLEKPWQGFTWKGVSKDAKEIVCISLFEGFIFCDTCQHMNRNLTKSLLSYIQFLLKVRGIVFVGPIAYKSSNGT